MTKGILENPGAEGTPEILTPGIIGATNTSVHDPIAASMAEALATRLEPKGVALAVETIRAKLDEDAHVLWMANGPRKSHIEELGAVLVSVEGVRHVMIVQGMASGDFKLFHEVPGKKGFDQIETLIAAGGE